MKSFASYLESNEETNMNQTLNVFPVRSFEFGLSEIIFHGMKKNPGHTSRVRLIKSVQAS